MSLITKILKSVLLFILIKSNIYSVEKINIKSIEIVINDFITFKSENFEIEKGKRLADLLDYEYKNGFFQNGSREISCKPSMIFNYVSGRCNISTSKINEILQNDKFKKKICIIIDEKRSTPISLDEFKKNENNVILEENGEYKIEIVIKKVFKKGEIKVKYNGEDFKNNGDVILDYSKRNNFEKISILYSFLDLIKENCYNTENKSLEEYIKTLENGIEKLKNLKFKYIKLNSKVIFEDYFEENSEENLFFNILLNDESKQNINIELTNFYLYFFKISTESSYHIVSKGELMQWLKEFCKSDKQYKVEDIVKEFNKKFNFINEDFYIYGYFDINDRKVGKEYFNNLLEEKIYYITIKDEIKTGKETVKNNEEQRFKDFRNALSNVWLYHRCEIYEKDGYIKKDNKKIYQCGLNGYLDLSDIKEEIGREFWLNNNEYDLYYIDNVTNEHKILTDNYLRNLELVEESSKDFNEKCKKNTFIIKIKDEYFDKYFRKMTEEEKKEKKKKDEEEKEREKKKNKNNDDNDQNYDNQNKELGYCGMCKKIYDCKRVRN